MENLVALIWEMRESLNYSLFQMRSTKVNPLSFPFAVWGAECGGLPFLLACVVLERPHYSVLKPHLRSRVAHLDHRGILPPWFVRDVQKILKFGP
jgi:hypothetical protein